MEGSTMPIAIVGMSCRLPGGITNPDGLWRACEGQKDLWQPFPPARLNQSAYYHPESSRKGTSNVKGAYFMDEHPGRFDARFFSVMPAEARAMDPQQRLLLELSYEALENAGMTFKQMVASDTAVFVGSSCQDYSDLLQRDADRTETYQSTGTGQTMLANRISYFYDLKGQSVTVDTACSSSLVALHLACSALRAGHSQAAIVGGSNLILTHEPTISLSMLRLLSPDGHCYTYDERANGFGRGEGAGCLILKPLANALQDGDPIRAVIRNTGSNQDGRTNGITLPDVDAQYNLIRRTYQAVGLDPSETTYVEAHGTGTAVGDPIEAASISRAFCQDKRDNQPLFVGSVKSNIGHLEGGSGIASIIKTVLMLEKKVVLPNFDFTRPNPRIPMDEWKIKVPTETQPWPLEAIERASVNNFGFGGSNAHVIIDGAYGYLESRKIPPMDTSLLQADTTNGIGRGNGSYHVNGDLSNFKAHDHQVSPEDERAARRGFGRHPTDSEGSGHTKAILSNGLYILDQGHTADKNSASYVFVISSFDEESGRRHARALRDYLHLHAKDLTAPLFREVAYTLGSRRSILSCKAAFMAASPTSLEGQLSKDRLVLDKSTSEPRLDFLFTGQGAQWHAMGRGLICQYAVFERSLEAASECLQRLGAPWRLLVELMKDPDDSHVNDASISQPLTTAIQIALVDLLASWNIRAKAVTGHSSGEIAAAYCAGALTQASALAVAYHRGRLASKVKQARDGAMLAVGLSAEDTQHLIDSLHNGCVSVACINSPSSVTVSGDKAGIIELHGILKSRNTFARQLSVSVAYHSQHMQDIAEEYLAALECLSVENRHDIADVEYYSSLTGKRHDLSDLGPEYWVANLTNPVQFSASLQSLLHGTKGPNAEVLVEIGPHSALRGPVKQILERMNHDKPNNIPYFSALVRNQNAVETCHNLVAQLFARGVPINMSAVNFPTGTQGLRVLTDMPSYSWDHSTSYWAESARPNQYQNETFTRSDLLGIRVHNSISSEPEWRNILRPSDIPWVHDHVVQGNLVYPAAGFIAMAIEAEHQHVKEKTHIKAYKLREVSVGHALVLAEGIDSVETRVSLRPYRESLRADSDIWNEFRISSSVDGSLWTEHSRGLIAVENWIEAAEVDSGQSPEVNHLIDADASQFQQITSRFGAQSKVVNVPEMYNELERIGLKFGPTFANMQYACTSPGFCLAQMTIPDTAERMPAHFEYPYVIHPATLDSCIHSIFPIDSQTKPKHRTETPVPTFIEAMTVSQNMSKEHGYCFDVFARSNKNPPGQKPSSSGSADYSITAFDQTGRDPGIKVTMDGLRVIYIANVSGDLDKPDDCYQTVWQPDPESLTAQQASELTRAFRKPYADRNLPGFVQQAAFYYAEELLQKIDDKVELLPRLLPHHEKYVSCLRRYRQDVHQGCLGDFNTSDWLKATNKQRQAIYDKIVDSSWGLLLSPIGRNLTQILCGEMDPLSLMLDDNRLERYYRTLENARQTHEQAAFYIKLLGNKNPHMKILEIGAGTGSATLPILEALGDGQDGRSPSFARYDFTDISPAFFDQAKEKLRSWDDLVTFKTLDAEQNPIEQGFEPASYDLIIAASVIHATSHIEDTMKRVKTLLTPGGYLILTEITVPSLCTSLIFGTLPGWWNAKEESRANGPLLTEAEWDDTLQRTGFTGADHILWDMPDPREHAYSAIISRRVTDSKPEWPPLTIITNSMQLDPEISPLERALVQQGVNYSISSLTESVTQGKFCIALIGLQESVLREPQAEEFAALKRAFLESEGVLWITRGAYDGRGNPDHNLVLGLVRTIRAEQGDTRIHTLDLDTENFISPEKGSVLFTSILKSLFEKNEDSDTQLENERVERGGVLMIPRLVKDETLNSHGSLPVPQEVEPQLFHQPGRPLKAEIQTPGLLDSIYFIDDESISSTLADGEVEVAVKASGLNFRDVMTALGQIAQYPLGIECAGVITSIGRGVRSVSVGDHVIATLKDGAFRNLIRSSADDVELIPKDIPFDIAAALPIAYFTAYWAVHKVARLSKGESILIHAASGGVGQALINLCKLVDGVVIYATVGTLEKRNQLIDRHGIPQTHIFSSRDTAFARRIMTMTQDRGVDVIMNSLSGEALRLTWSCIAPFGRFVELGKRDFTVNTRLEMRHFEKNVSFTGLDVPLDSQHGEKRRIWGEIMKLYNSQLIQAPWPVKVLGISELESALRSMQSGKHMGKMVLMPQPGEMVKAVPPPKPKLLHHDASYVLVGGLGGIGRAIAHWMVDNGARNLIFASPSGADKPKAREAVQALEIQGARVLIFKCNIANPSDVSHLLAAASKTMPPLRGLLHCAQTWRPSLFAKMSLEDYNAAMLPKVSGVWNLHNALLERDMEVDFFIMLSSLLGLSGDASQASYCAAATFLDAFAAYRSNLNLPAVSLDLGKVVDVGVVAERIAAREAVRDLWSRDLYQEEITRMVEAAIRHPLRKQEDGAAAANVIGLKPWSEQADPVFNAPLFSHFRRAALSTAQTPDGNVANGGNGRRGTGLRDALHRATTLAEGTTAVCNELILKTSHLLMKPVEDISAESSLLELGMDSLVAVELRNWLLKEVDAAVPVLELMANITLGQLAGKVVKQSRFTTLGNEG